MSIEYLVDGKKYLLSYQGLREEYYRYCGMTDEQFMKEIAGALHLACVICFLKEVPTYVCLSDVGIIHELAHILHAPNEPLVDLKQIRNTFKIQLHLS